MPLTYATADELTTFLGEAPTVDEAKLDRWLVIASALVRHATRTAIYDTHATGLPSDLDVAEAFRDATCVQVSAWIDADVDPTLGVAGVSAVPQSSSIGGASVTYGSEAQAAAKAATISELVPEAWAYLADLPRGIYVWG